MIGLYEGPQATFDLSREALAFSERRGIVEVALQGRSGDPTLLAELGRTEQALAEAGPIADRIQIAGDMSGLEPRGVQLRLRAETGLAEQAPHPEPVPAAGRGGAVQTEVCDMGVGIQPDQLNRIFDRFYRGSGPTTRHVRGTGLGLAICRGIVEAHGGKIWADSQPGQGARIMFTVPVVNPAGSEGGNPQ